LTRVGARNANEMVMLTCRTLHFIESRREFRRRSDQGPEDGHSDQFREQREISLRLCGKLDAHLLVDVDALLTQTTFTGVLRRKILASR
jgi:hypothetical protein